MNALEDRGEKVIVRTYGGRAEIRFLWESRAAGFIVTEQPGDNTLAVGIPACDVFVPSSDAIQAINAGGPVRWATMDRFRPA